MRVSRGEVAVKERKARLVTVAGVVDVVADGQGQDGLLPLS